MSGYYGGPFDFPHTRTYESDLGWVITKIKEILAVYADFEARISKNTEDIAAINAEMDSFTSYIEAEVTAMQTRVDEAIANMNRTLEAFYQQYQGDFAEFRREYEAAFAAQTVQVMQLMEELRNYVNSSNASLRAYVDSRQMETQTYIDLQIDAMYDYVDSIVLDLTVKNPITGKDASLEEVLNEFYDLIRTGAFTAETFDASQITCTAFDSSLITAYEFDTAGQNKLYEDPKYYMYHPETGEFVPVQTVVNYLAGLHMLDSNTAAEYDALDKTATEYDALDYTAYDYDWHSKQIA